jgi:hypothetical protein
MINGKISRGYNLGNGVKQDDTLSCSMFILAMEPVIRNIQMNSDIQAIESHRLRYIWPKVIAYADDITILMESNADSIQGIFKEYVRLTAASGLMLNADKTEFTFGNIIPAPEINITYCNTTHMLCCHDSIKINAIVFSNDTDDMHTQNFNTMEGHFKGWSKHSLSLLRNI